MSVLRNIFNNVSFFIWVLLCGVGGTYATYFFVSFLPKSLSFSKQLVLIYDAFILFFECTLSDADALIVAVSLPILELSFLSALLTLLFMRISKKIALRFLRSPF